MSDFDPNAFLDETKHFDPESFLAETSPDQFVERDGVHIPLPRPDERAAFDSWANRNNVNEPFHPDHHYDNVGAFRAGIDRDGESAHFPDTFKLPGHPTFSNQSKYATGENAAKAGSWVGDDYIPASAIAARQQMPLMERARAAARKMQKLGGIDALDPDERQALKQALGKLDASKQVGGLEAANLLGANAAMGEMGDEAVGLAGGDKEALRERLHQAEQQHPTIGTLSKLAGAGAVGAMLPASKVAAVAQGALSGYGSSEGDWKDQLAKTLLGGSVAGYASMALPIAARAAGDAAGQVANGVTSAAGKVLQAPKQGLDALKSWLGGAAEAAPSKAPPPGVAGFEQQMADVAAANPARAFSEDVTRTAARPLPQNPLRPPTIEEQLAEVAAANSGAPRVGSGHPPEPLPQNPGRPLSMEEQIQEAAAHNGNLALKLNPEQSLDEPSTGMFRAPIDRSPEAVAADAAEHGRTQVLSPKEWPAQWERMNPGQKYNDPQEIAQVMRDVNAQGIKNVPDPAMLGYREGDAAALEKLQQTKPWEVPDEATGKWTTNDLMDMKGRARDDNLARSADLMQHDSGAPVQNWMERFQERSPEQQMSRKFDNASGRMAPDLNGVSDNASSDFSDRMVGMNEARQRQGWDVDSRVTSAPSSPYPSPTPAAPASVSLRFKNKQEAWNKLKDAGGIDGGDTSAADAAYEAWKAGLGQKPPPFEGGHFDAINQRLGLTGDKRVSGAREAFDLMTRGRRSFDDIDTAIRSISEVPGFEKLRLPDDVQDKIVDRGSFNFGQNLDPRKNERGFGSIDLLATMAGIKPVGAVANASANVSAKLGKMMQQASERGTPGAIAAGLVSDPALVQALAQMPGKLGLAGQSILEASRSGGDDAAKARAFVISQQPWFRQQFVQGTAEQASPGQAASGQ